MRAKIVIREPATVFAADPRSPTGVSAMPATGPAREIVTLRSARNSYQAALKLLAVESGLSRSLLDATA